MDAKVVGLSLWSRDFFANGITSSRLLQGAAA